MTCQAVAALISVARCGRSKRASAAGVAHATCTECAGCAHLEAHGHKAQAGLARQAGVLPGEAVQVPGGEPPLQLDALRHDQKAGKAGCG